MKHLYLTIFSVLISCILYAQGVTESEAQFPGGIDSLSEYLNKSINYPLSARQNRQEGMVVLSVGIRFDGTIDTLQVLQGVCPSIDSEAIRIVRSMPRWEPGRQGGKPVSSVVSLPIQFLLPGENLSGIKHTEERIPINLVKKANPNTELADYFGSTYGIHYPEVMVDSGISGRVIIGFILRKNGNIDSVHILKGLHKMLDVEAKKYLTTMLRLKPCIQNGVAIDTFLKVGFRFTLRNVNPSDSIAINLNNHLPLSFLPILKLLYTDKFDGVFKAIDLLKKSQPDNSDYLFLEAITNYNKGEYNIFDSLINQILIPRKIDGQIPLFFKISLIDSIAKLYCPSAYFNDDQYGGTTKVDKIAEFPGTSLSVTRFISNNILFPAEVLNNELNGIVTLRLEIAEDGTVENASIHTMLYPCMGEEALRLARLLPKFVPAEKNGKPVRSVRFFGINFNRQSILYYRKINIPELPKELKPIQKLIDKEEFLPAMELINSLLEKVPNDITYLTYKALIYLHAGNTGRACENINKVKQIGDAQGYNSITIKEVIESLLDQYCKEEK